VTTRLLLLAAVVAGIASGSSSGARLGSTVFVAQQNPRCSDAGKGSASQPFCSISGAALKVTPGSTVVIASGTYTGPVILQTSGTRHAPIVFRPKPGATVLLTGKSGFSLSGVSWITISGFTITRTVGYGISVVNGSHVALLRNRVSQAGQRVPGRYASGIYLRNVSDSLILKNVAFANTYAGILLTYGATRNVVGENLVYGNRTSDPRRGPGIRLWNAPSNTVTGNISYGNEGSGIEIHAGSDSALVTNNVVYGNGNHGIDAFRSTSARLLANTVHENITAGINIQGGSHDSVIENNIAVDNGVDSPRTKGNIRVDASSSNGTLMNFDLVYLTPSSQTTTTNYVVVWGRLKAVQLADFQAATGQETRGIQADPAWVDAEAGNYHLRAGSVAIDSANSSVPGQPARDVERRDRFDAPRVANSGAGRKRYVDRGAFEFRPRR